MGRGFWLLLVALAGLLWVAQDVEASHLRGGSLEWSTTGDSLEVEFDGRLFGRHGYEQWASGARPDVGDTVDSGSLATGDGGAMSYAWVVEFVSDAGTAMQDDDWFSARLTGGGSEGGPRHTYTDVNDDGAPYLVTWSDSARLGSGDGHVNNDGFDLVLQTAVDLTGPDGRSPQVLFPPIVPCERDTVCSFRIPGLGNETRAFRFASSLEASNTESQPGLPVVGGGSEGFDQPGHGQASVANAEVAADGTYTWDTSGAAESTAEQTYYSTQVMLEDANGKAPMDFFIQLVDDLADRPYWIEDPCDETVVVPALQEFKIRRHATADVRTTITVDVLGAPRGSTVTQHIGGGLTDPGWAELTWTPSNDERSTIIVFGAYAASGAQAPVCSVTLELDPNDPPIADFTFTAARDWVGDIHQFQDESDAADEGDSIVNWTWELDGDIWSLEQHPKRSFPSVGTHLVTLTVEDARGGSDSVTKPVQIVNAPPTADFLVPEQVMSGVQVVLEDNSTDTGVNDRLESWVWAIDGEAPTGQSIVWTFDTPGRNGVCLTVTDSYGATDSICKSVEVINRAPTVSIDVEPGTPAGSTGVPYLLTCVVDDVDGHVETCFWDFGDGVTATGLQVEHTWAAASTNAYTVTARAVDDLGAEGTGTTEILIHNQAPFVRINFGREADDPENRVRFDSESYDLGGGAIQHAWDLAGTESNQVDPVHDFPDANSVYRIELTVTDTEGASTTGVLFVRPADLSGVQDRDGDGHADDRDVCPDLADPGQRDADGDGKGDVCDADRDGDAVADDEDAFPDDAREWSDFDGDGIGDHADADDDGDGVGDAEERALGTDPRSKDSDGDGIDDGDELAAQTDPNDPLAPDWRARNLSVTPVAVGWLVSWDADDPRAVGFQILVNGTVVAELDGDARNATIVQGGDVQLRTLHAHGIEDPMDTHAVPTQRVVAATDSGPAWPWFVGAGFALVAAGGGVWWWRRRVS